MSCLVLFCLFFKKTNLGMLEARGRDRRRGRWRKRRRRSRRGKRRSSSGRRRGRGREKEEAFHPYFATAAFTVNRLLGTHLSHTYHPRLLYAKQKWLEHYIICLSS